MAPRLANLVTAEARHEAVTDVRILFLRPQSRNGPHRANVATNWGLISVSQGGQVAEALRVDRAPSQTRPLAENAACSSTLLVAAVPKRLELEIAAAEAPRAVRLDSLGWARTDLGSGWLCGQKCRNSRR